MDSSTWTWRFKFVLSSLNNCIFIYFKEMIFEKGLVALAVTHDSWEVKQANNHTLKSRRYGCWKEYNTENVKSLGCPPIPRQNLSIEVYDDYLLCMNYIFQSFLFLFSFFLWIYFSVILDTFFYLFIRNGRFSNCLNLLLNI